MGWRGAESHAGHRRWCWKELGMRGTDGVEKGKRRQSLRNGYKGARGGLGKAGRVQAVLGGRKWKRRESGEDMDAEGRERAQPLSSHQPSVSAFYRHWTPQQFKLKITFWWKWKTNLHL